LREIAHEGSAGIDLLERDEFIRLVRLIDRAGAAKDGREMRSLEMAGLAAVGDGNRAVSPGELERQGLGDRADKMIVATKSYETTDPTVDSQVVALQASGADVLLTAAVPKFAAQAIRKVFDIGWKPTHFLSFPSSSIGGVMRPAGLEKSIGIISATAFKDATDPQWRNTPEYDDWLAWMQKYNPSASLSDVFNVDGYSRGQAIVSLLKACGDNLTRENVIKQAASMHDLKLPMLLPGITLSTSADDYQPIKQMQLQKFDGNTWQLFGEVISGSGS